MENLEVPANSRGGRIKRGKPGGNDNSNKPFEHIL